MIKKYSNKCSLCGTDRIIVKTWEEKIYNSVIICTQTACPNVECQKIVDRDNKKQSDKYALMKLRSEQRAKQRHQSRDKEKEVRQMTR